MQYFKEIMNNSFSRSLVTDWDGFKLHFRWHQLQQAVPHPTARKNKKRNIRMLCFSIWFDSPNFIFVIISQFDWTAKILMVFNLDVSAVIYYVGSFDGFYLPVWITKCFWYHLLVGSLNIQNTPPCLLKYWKVCYHRIRLKTRFAIMKR